MHFAKTNNHSVAKIKSNTLDKGLIVMSNMLARAKTSWGLNETRLFLATLTQINTIDNDGYITVNKADLMVKMDGIYHMSDLRKIAKAMMDKSFIRSKGSDPEIWHDGFVFYDVKADKKNLYIATNKSFLPHLIELSSHFTEFYLDNVIKFNRKGSVMLYMWLESWADHNNLEHEAIMTMDDIKQIFNLSDTEYWRKDKYGKLDRFDWYSFEKWALFPAIQEFRENEFCDILIYDVSKYKRRGLVEGYVITWTYINTEDGNGLKW